MRNRELDADLDALVTALCRDFERRCLLILSKNISKRTETEFRYLNYGIFKASREICLNDDDALAYINEIGRKVGYAKSKLESVSEVTYKETKASIKENIARRLHLKD